MAKGRKHGSSSDHHDRLLLGTYGYSNGHVPSKDQPDFFEDDVWMTSSSDQGAANESWLTSYDSDQVSSRHRTARDSNHRHVGGLSLAFEDRYTSGPTVIHQYRNVDSPSNRHVAAAAASSAPVNVPGWSKMVRVDSTDSMNNWSVELDRDESEWVPPHEYLARENGRTVTTSVFEGVGRTLKGRDMSRVRNVVWSKTGFFG